jgi:succinoglycan biosynthesis protein ExoL
MAAWRVVTWVGARRRDAEGSVLKVVYFVHDLSDPAVARRIGMLRQAGAEVTLFGFRRTPAPVAVVAGVEAFDLGRTADAKLLARCASVLSGLCQAPLWRTRLANADVVMARNLEVYVVAALARRLHAPAARLVYECLDVHRLMIGAGAAGRALRAIEGGLMNASDLLIVSSPAFVRDYFEPLQHLSARPLDTLLVENKALPEGPSDITPPLPGPPWRIGWFGMIRCRRSLDFLCRLAERRPELVRVEIRGRPSYTEFEDFDRQAADTPGVSFGGAYAPSDLPGMYGAVHFNWAIDRFQDEGNSRWLLPNRLYEGGRFGVPPIARLDAETGRWLQARALGVLFDEPEIQLEAFLDALTPQAYLALAARHRAAPKGLFVQGPEDCERLVRALGGETAPAAADALAVA